jgi:hypothetical protein
MLATLLAFSVSALIHEYALSVAVGRIEGYQTAFFLLQGAAVAGSLRWNPGSLVGRASTLVFNVATSMFFMASIESLAPGAFARYGLPSLTSIL